MADKEEMSGEAEVQDVEVEATNKSLSEFLADRVEGINPEPNKEVEAEADASDSTVELDKEPKEGEEKEKKEGEEKEGEDKEAKEGEEKEGEAADKGTEEVAEGEPVPYDRFKEVNDEKVQYQQLVEDFRPKAENFDRIANFTRENSITPEQFEEAMRVQALLNNDPEQALAKLLPIVEKLQGFVGNKLPEDLQKKVDAGKMELEDARDFARTRARADLREQSVKRQQELAGLRAQQDLKRQVETSTAEWEKRIRTSDPDYKPKAKASDPDGLWENTRDKYLAWINLQDNKGNFAHPIKTVQEMTALMQKAYESAKATFTAVRKPTIKPKLGSNGSRSGYSGPKKVEDAKTMREAIDITLQQRGR